LPLPLQKKPRDVGHSVFVDDNLRVYPYQWAFLASVEPMSPQDIEAAILRATGPTHPLDVTFIDEEDLATPWKRPIPDKAILPGTIPDALTITLANLVYFEKTQLTQPLTNRLIRLAAFKNPEFYRAQAMRMSKKQRANLIAELDALPPDSPRILLATGRLVGEGFDHPPLDTLVLTMPVSWKGTLQQCAGRLHREHAAKTNVRIIDFVDTAHPALLRMWEKRQRGYRAMGYRIAEPSELERV
jgi:hypothetical protein